MLGCLDTIVYAGPVLSGFSETQFTPSLLLYTIGFGAVPPVTSHFVPFQVIPLPDMPSVRGFQTIPSALHAAFTPVVAVPTASHRLPLHATSHATVLKGCVVAANQFAPSLE